MEKYFFQFKNQAKNQPTGLVAVCNHILPYSILPRNLKALAIIRLAWYLFTGSSSQILDLMMPCSIAISGMRSSLLVLPFIATKIIFRNHLLVSGQFTELTTQSSRAFWIALLSSSSLWKALITINTAWSLINASFGNFPFRIFILTIFSESAESTITSGVAFFLSIIATME